VVIFSLRWPLLMSLKDDITRSGIQNNRLVDKWVTTKTNDFKPFVSIQINCELFESRKYYKKF